jgi:hypothetical protein
MVISLWMPEEMSKYFVGRKWGNDLPSPVDVGIQSLLIFLCRAAFIPLFDSNFACPDSVDDVNSLEGKEWKGANGMTNFEVKHAKWKTNWNKNYFGNQQN